MSMFGSMIDKSHTVLDNLNQSVDIKVNIKKDDLKSKSYIPHSLLDEEIDSDSWASMSDKKGTAISGITDGPFSSSALSANAPIISSSGKITNQSATTGQTITNAGSVTITSSPITSSHIAPVIPSISDIVGNVRAGTKIKWTVESDKAFLNGREYEGTVCVDPDNDSQLKVLVKVPGKANLYNIVDLPSKYEVTSVPSTLPFIHKW